MLKLYDVTWIVPFQRLHTAYSKSQKNNFAGNKVDLKHKDIFSISLENF